VPLGPTADIAGTIVRYVARTGEPVVLDEATRDPRFAADPYLTERRPRSILCLAMAQNERLTGVLYLENNAASSAFTRARVDLSGLLASLAATAVENALLYARVEEVTQALRRANESLESEVSRRTEDLRTTNLRLEIELSERERAEQARGALHEEITRMQEERLAEISTPILPITDRIVVMPLIGTMDARRGRQVLEAALSGVRSSQAEVVILDVTGMRLVEVDVVDMLAKTASALRLLGARALVTGMSPEVARALVARGAGLESMVTLGTLKAAVAHALRARSA
jgi:GAF domain-containing protein